MIPMPVVVQRYVKTDAVVFRKVAISISIDDISGVSHVTAETALAISNGARR